MIFMEERTNHTKGDKKHNSSDTLCHCFSTDCCFFLLLFSAAFVNAGHELHNVSGHLSVNWSYLIIEVKTIRESGQVSIIRNSFVETGCQKRRFSLVYRVYFLAIQLEVLR